MAWFVHTAEPAWVPDSVNLLDYYAPELIYDSLDTYRADAASELTDNANGSDENVLYVPSYEGPLPIATPPLLSLDLLTADGAQYMTDPDCGPLLRAYRGGGGSPDGRRRRATQCYPVTENDYIDEADSYASDFARMHAEDQYRDRIYGRVFSAQDGSKVLQYWFFYYDQPNFAEENTRGGHEGDWEGI
jgi:hypothetical protein